MKPETKAKLIEEFRERDKEREARFIDESEQLRNMFSQNQNDQQLKKVKKYALYFIVVIFLIFILSDLFSNKFSFIHSILPPLALSFFVVIIYGILAYSLFIANAKTAIDQGRANSKKVINIINNPIRYYFYFLWKVVITGSY